MRILIMMLAVVLLNVRDAGAAQLKNNISINADVIRVGDIFADSGDAADIVVGKAPAPGKRRMFDRTRLVVIARNAKLDWTPRGRFVRVDVRRASRVVGSMEIEDAVSQALTAGGMRGDREVKLLNRGLKIHVATDQAVAFEVTEAAYNERTGRFTAMLTVRGNAGAAGRVRVTGRVYTLVDVPVLNRRVRPGEPIGRRDIDWVRMRAERLARNAILDESSIVGQTPRRFVRAGAPLRQSDVRAPVIVTKGSLVTLKFRTRNMILTAKARAAQDGARGDTIRVVNIRSKRTIEGVVDGAGSVFIPGYDMTAFAQGGAR